MIEPAGLEQRRLLDGYPECQSWDRCGPLHRGKAAAAVLLPARYLIPSNCPAMTLGNPLVRPGRYLIASRYWTRPAAPQANARPLTLRPVRVSTCSPRSP